LNKPVIYTMEEDETENRTDLFQNRIFTNIPQYKG
jgi:hypothetical protein